MQFCTVHVYHQLPKPNFSLLGIICYDLLAVLWLFSSLKYFTEAPFLDQWFRVILINRLNLMNLQHSYGLVLTFKTSFVKANIFLFWASANSYPAWGNTTRCLLCMRVVAYDIDDAFQQNFDITILPTLYK